MPDKFYKKYGKRLFDIVVSLIGIIILSPILLIIYIVIRIFDQGPALFKQVRMGKDFKKFTMFKFRTMITQGNDKDPLVTSSEDKRITRAGQWLRRFKLDELPQLFNVLLGDISFVGPRPEMEKFVNFYKEEYSRVLSVSPGITDYATLQYKDESELLQNADDIEDVYIRQILPKKIELYLKYIENMSFKNDIRLIWKTILGIFK
jgi:lipopolysaccharide/colanic/teichoic acid biosynthesis glycosyltransferase